MPSARKQKVKEEQSIQSDVISDVENLDVGLGIFTGNDYANELGNEQGEMDSVSA